MIRKWERKNLKVSRVQEILMTAKIWMARVTFHKLRWFLCLFICRFKKYDSINTEYGSDLEIIDAKLGNRKKLHVVRWDTILLFMIRYLIQPYGIF